MQFGLTLLEKIGLLPHKAGQIDPTYDQRLQRIGARETLRVPQTGPFTGQTFDTLRNRPEHPAA
ncbi:hypothetical protein [Paragemmobacter ruber]|uniref:Uncharacterized protein n=1 Tax=Paragemmobacter ruber TaxID=1985673 RepID=A0ABW9Y731_9RHOB|nr:hypothetical protein [Rhodobacter ruber]NBE07610.1 hypothetical protein [Rhodobacter ruber]